MRKERSYDFKKVDVCRNCHGRGIVTEITLSEPRAVFGYDPHPIMQESHTETEVECEVCNGTGRIVKTTHVDITIEPYKGGPI